MLKNKFLKKEKIIKTHESIKILEKKKRDAKKRLYNEKMNKRLEKIRNFIISERDYMIFLAMLLIVSILFEPVGFSKTLPLIIIVPFILGTFYSAKKKVFYHTIVAILILSTVHRDVTYAAFVIILGTFCTFASIYLAKYLEQVKKYNIFQKLTKGLIATILAFLSIFIYLSRFGSPFEYMKAQDEIMKFASEKYNDQIIYRGINYNYNTRLYEAEYLYKEDNNILMKFTYNKHTEKVSDGYEKYIKDKHESEISNALKVLIAEKDISKLENLHQITVEFDENMSLKPDQSFDFKMPISVTIKLKNKEISLEVSVDGINNEYKVLTDDDLYFMKNQIERITKNLKMLKVEILDSDNIITRTLEVSYDNGLVVNEILTDDLNNGNNN